MTTGSGMIGGVCGHCGHWHTGTCPKIKMVHYYPNGTIRCVEYHDDRFFAPPPTQPVAIEGIPGMTFNESDQADE